MKNFFAEYGYTPDKEAMGRALDLIAANLENMVTRPVLLSCFSMMDVTSLKTDDTRTSIRRLVEKVNNLQKEYPDYPMPASICVYPDFVETVKASKRCDDVHITAVAGCFPSSQSFLEVKLLECGMAVEKGADEIDIVLALNDFLDEEGISPNKAFVLDIYNPDEKGCKNFILFALHCHHSFLSEFLCLFD